MKIPYVLRAPSYPAVVPVDVVTGARPAVDEDQVPKEAQRLAERAVAAGWQVLVTYAEARGTKLRRAPAPAEDKRRWVMEPCECSIPSVAVRLLNPGKEMRIAIWRDGVFDVGLRLLPEGLIKVGASDIKDLGGPLSTGVGHHRRDDGWLRHEHDR
jgi:hypothetical protein